MTEPNQDDSPNLSQEKLSREEPNSPTSPSYIEDADSAGEKDPAYSMFIIANLAYQFDYHAYFRPQGIEEERKRGFT